MAVVIMGLMAVVTMGLKAVVMVGLMAAVFVVDVLNGPVKEEKIRVKKDKHIYKVIERVCN